MELRILGIMDSWNHGYMEPWIYRIKDLWNPRTLESLIQGIMESWIHDSLESCIRVSRKMVDLGVTGIMKSENYGTLNSRSPSIMFLENHGFM